MDVTWIGGYRLVWGEGGDVFGIIMLVGEGSLIIKP
jgi:hypothetical protein